MSPELSKITSSSYNCIFSPQLRRAEQVEILGISRRNEPREVTRRYSTWSKGDSRSKTNFSTTRGLTLDESFNVSFPLHQSLAFQFSMHWVLSTNLTFSRTKLTRLTVGVCCSLLRREEDFQTMPMRNGMMTFLSWGVPICLKSRVTLHWYRTPL